ncbi:MAG: glycosyltransferase family 2 protein [Acidimicrobiia bacterium]
MSRTPTFSVIIPTYGRPRFLDAAIESVLAQTVEDFELIVVDDASPQPVEVGDDRRISVVRRLENGGPAIARNTGLVQARGRFVTFLDDDDLYTPERLQFALEGLERAPVTVCERRGLDGTLPALERILEGDASDIILDDMTPHLGQVAIERERAPRFDERFPALQDVEWWLRTASSMPLSTVSKLGHLYRAHGDQRHRNTVAERIRCSLLLLEIHPRYFETHSRARGFRWKRIGLMAQSIGDHALARAAFTRSLKSTVQPRTAWHLMKSLRSSQPPYNASSRTESL